MVELLVLCLLLFTPVYALAICIAKECIAISIQKSKVATERIEQLREARRRLLAYTRHEDYIKETAMLYGIDSNEAEVDTYQLIMHGRALQKKVGSPTLKRIIKLIKFQVRNVKRKVSDASYVATRLISASDLITIPECSIIHHVRMGGDDDEAAFQTV